MTSPSAVSLTFPALLALILLAFLAGAGAVLAFMYWRPFDWMLCRTRGGSLWIRAVVRSLPGSFLLLTDNNFRCRVADGDGLAAIGLSPRTIEGQPINTIIPHDIVAAAVDTRRPFGYNGHDSSEIAIRDHIFAVSASPIRCLDGRILGTLTVSRDVTEQRQAERALRRSEELFRGIFQHASDGIMLIDGHGTLFAWNPAQERITGISAAQVVGLPAWEAQRLVLPPERDTPERSARAREALMQVLSGEDTSLLDRMTEARIIAADRTERYIQERHFLVETPEARYLAVFVRDVTRNKRAEEQRIADTLNQQRMNVLTTFIRDASHEFRTPLSIINTKLYFIERLADNERQKPHVDGIREQVNSIVRLLDSLVTITRLDMSEVAAPVPVSLEKVLHLVADAAAPLAQAEHLTLSLELPPALPPVCANEDDLTEAFTQIVNNAVRYTPAGGAVLISASAESEQVVVTVRDTGVGIPADALPHIFDRFFRLDDAHSTRGFGLGLPIARRVAELYGGHISVESEESVGTVVRMAFPAC